MNKHTHIVVGVDGSDDGLRAAEYAAVEARVRSAGIRLVHALQHQALVSPRVAAFGVEDVRLAGKRALEAAELRVAQIDPAVPVAYAISAAPRALALVDAAKTAALVVVGRRPVHGLRRILSGSTSTAVAARATAPVIAVPATWSRGPRRRRIVLGSDGSAHGQDAIAFAFAEASRRHAPLTVVRAWQVPLRWYGDLMPVASDEPDWSESATRLLTENLAGWAGTYPDVPVTRVVEHSPTSAELLLEHVDDAALLVVGARGGGGLPGLDLGWTARSVIAHAPCPTAVVHLGDVLTTRNAASARGARAGTSGVG